MKTPLPPLAGLCVGLLVAGSPAHAALACDQLRSEIEAKIISGGMTRFSLTVVDANAPATGKVVGSCEQGSRKIVYAPQAAAPGAVPPAPPAGRERILTECRDGTVSMGGSCKP